ncbi:TPA: hypothetical protein N0F65_003889 [Lagenidium giganteum]|uniref:ABC transporter n=1 Tax=Lagenidium giganteum TaxID=4803 RepID=A0AAV2ZCH0_9STRA|nr:TPA: hypothetical protein N0F65_003889 [Lagenidium giganteum]
MAPPEHPPLLTRAALPVEDTCSWFDRLTFRFYPKLLTPAARAKGCRLQSLDDFSALPQTWQTHQGRDAFVDALQSSLGLFEAIWKTDRRALLQAVKWGVVEAVAKALAVLQLIAIVWMAAEVPRPSVSAVAWHVGALQLTRAVAAAAQTQTSFTITSVALRVTNQLRTLALECVMQRTPLPVEMVGSRPGLDASLTPSATAAHAVLRSHIRLAESTVSFLHFIPGLVEGITSWVLLERLVGSHVGTVTFVVSVLLNVAISQMEARSTYFVGRWRQAHDHTIQCLHDYFCWFLPVKLFAWENKLLARVRAARAEEDLARRTSVVQLVAMTYLNSAFHEALVGVLLAGLLSFGVELSVIKMFTTAILVNIVRYSVPAIILILVHVADQGHSFSRVLFHVLLRHTENVKQSKEMPNAVDQHAVMDASAIEQIQFQNVMVSSRNQPLLINVTATILPGELVVVHGPTGAGKSLLLRMVTREVTPQHGSVVVPAQYRSIAYCAQESWLQAMSIRDNILFGAPYCEAKYRCVLEACALVKDLQAFVDGDRTMVERRGLNLSGGQQARIALARACYADADLYLIDCTLDAVDPQVQSHVLKQCVCRLLGYKTVVLVAQNPEVLSTKFADRVLEVKDMAVSETECNGKQQGKLIRRVKYLADSQSESRKREHSGSGLALWSAVRVNARETIFDTTKDPDALEARSGENAVEDILKQVNLRSAFVFTFFATLAAILHVSKDLWFGFSVVSSSSPQAAWIYCVMIASYYGVLVLLSLIVGKLLFAFSNTLMDEVATAIVHASPTFFRSVPLGELLCRFRTDMTGVDLDVHFAVLVVCTGMTGLVAIAVVLCSVLGVAAVLMICLTAFKCLLFATDTTERDIAKITNVIESQEDEYIDELLGGVGTICALGDGYRLRFVQQLQAIRDKSAKVVYFTNAYSCAGILRDEFLHIIMLLVLIWAISNTDLSTNALGLVCYYIVFMPRQVMLLAIGYVGCFTRLNSVDRIRHLHVLALRHQTPIQSDSAPADWPKTGTVVFERVCFQYGTHTMKPLMGLQHVSFSIRSGEKIGVVGRSGSGKSTIAMALFRIYELTSGRILIDDLDTRLVPLHDLRRSIGIIPQSPVFYKCSVRAYLDPFDEYGDAALWTSLKKVGLTGSQHNRVQSLEDNLAHDGSNWSMGQRQLLSMARTLLKPTRILVLDEAFSSLEQSRDDALLQLVSSEFAQSTVFLITHRMDQLLHFDRIVVMDEGRAVEVGTVHELVANPNSVFFDFLETCQLTL